MNIERLKYFENVMRSFDQCDMRTFQHGEVSTVNLAEFHTCGNTACFAGRVAIDPKFHDDGGWVEDGIPFYKGFDFEDAIAEYLGISLELAVKLVYGDRVSYLDDCYSRFYEKNWNEVKGPDVADKLLAIINGEIE